MCCEFDSHPSHKMPYKDIRKQREYQRQWMAERRASWIQDKRCNKCNSLENLEIHHIDRSIKVDHRIWSWSEERRLEELAKCIVLCNDCHKIETKEQVSHHGISQYRQGCRCNICKSAKQVENRNYRESKKLPSYAKNI